MSRRQQLPHLAHYDGRCTSRATPKKRALIIIALVVILAIHARLLITNNLSRFTQTKKSITAETVLLEDLGVFKLPSGLQEPPHMSDLDPNVLIEVGRKDIDAVHSEALIHIGAWIFVTDADGLFLLIQRGPELVTCPNAWGIVGEHTTPDEEPIETAKRGISEELGDDLLDEIKSIQNLTETPQYLVFDWGHRVDRQLTYIWHAQLGKRHEDLHLVLDDEVANHKWLDMDKLKKQLRKEINGTHEVFCVPTETEYYVNMINTTKLPPER